MENIVAENTSYPKLILFALKIDLFYCNMSSYCQISLKDKKLCFCIYSVQKYVIIKPPISMDLIPISSQLMPFNVKSRYLEADIISLDAQVFTVADTLQFPSPHPLMPCHYAKSKYLEVRVCIVGRCNSFSFLVITIVKLDSILLFLQ